ncbi:diguanylate cyclase [Actinosynnema pretiosum subsp. pretiosum]|uniref:Diguanylate cyclase/phosphodiesterase with PAS/PAC sensor(S) n=2 Tax=Actinosynnema TaxID=40566 RepID=C6WA45_ACTMD|nr:diguanylate cyclase [Actinosynnema mirum]ACU39234.1 diguanylate cyclase/phosphodiesterase with PAS/PAC sensor(s) [Actinosynnema mirum DSM 43827]QUF03293.1 diguanylate cyclase [Actinosynnema pretiosum subsp. pretiosum]
MTQPSRPVPLTGSAPPAGAPSVGEVAERWTGELVRTAYSPIARAKVRRKLVQHVGLLDELLASPDLPADEAVAVGEWLVTARFTGDTSLGSSLEVLGRALAARAPDSPERVAELLGAVAGGYAARLRLQVFGEHEEVRASLLAALERTRVELHDSEARFRQVFAHSAAGIAVFDADGELLESNAALTGMLGPDFGGQDLSGLRGEWAAMAVRGEDVSHVEQMFLDPSGDPLWTNVALSVVAGEDGGPRYHLAVVEDVTEQRMLREYLRHQALHDVLTGLPNRQSFLPKLEEVLGRPGSITLCYLDVDSVAIVNDGLGYEYGDELLKVVAGRLTSVAEGLTATVARIGGDEFVVLVEDGPGTPSISELAAMIDGALAEPVRLAGHAVGVSAGMGFVRTAARGLDAMALLRQAHSTLRRAETGGKGQWGIYDAGHDEKERSRLSLIAAMPGALETGEIAIDYRDVRDRSGERVALAARLRWEHDGTTVGHDDCLRYADELGLAGALAEWLLDEACSFASLEALPVLVRLSADQSRDPDLSGLVGGAVRGWALAEGQLWLSLDSAAAGLGEEVEENLSVLADMGVRRLLHGCALGQGELALLERQRPHGVEPAGAPDGSELARRAREALLPMVRGAGALVLSERADDDADLVVG